MTAAKKSDTTSSEPLLSETQSAEAYQYVIVLTPYPPPHRHILLRKSCRRCLFCFSFFVVFLVAAGYILWPSNPELSVDRLRLDRLRFDTGSGVSIDVGMGVKVKVRNPAVYSLKYDWLVVAIGYRGNKLGFVTSKGGLIKARESYYVNTTLELDQVKVLSDLVLLVEDLKKGEVTFDTVSEISAKLEILSLELPLKTESKCGVTVSTWNQSIARQSCYPEVTEI